MRWMLIAGAALGALGVALGAFGAHALDGVLDARARGWYESAATYHARHALALVACGLLAALAAPSGVAARRAVRLAQLAGTAFVVGIALFSGSLYAMAFTGWTRFGLITPLGGLALIAGWTLFAVAAARLPAALSSGDD